MKLLSYLRVGFISDPEDKQGGDTIVTTKRVRETTAFSAELVDDSTWLWLTSEQMGFPLRPTGGGEHEERAEDLDSSQRVRDHLVVYHLSPAITDFIVLEAKLNTSFTDCQQPNWQERFAVHA